MYKLIPLGVKTKGPLNAQVSTLQEQKDGSFLAGFLFADRNLLSFKIENKTLSNVKDLELEKLFGGDVLGITGGLRGTSTGDTAFATLHKSGSGLMGMFKKSAAPASSLEFWDDLATGKGSFGFSYKHSIVQIVDGAFRVRSSKQSGALLDAAHIGDFIFGLAGGCIFREPYLNSEKRYFLREDLEPNFRFHKVDDGVFWLAGDQNKLMKLGLTDNKALPTTKKVPAIPMRASVDCNVDGWLYAVAGNYLFRIRVNPENKLDELQIVKKFEDGIPLSVATKELKVKEDEARKAKVWVSVAKEIAGKKSTALYSLESARPEDMEELPPIPELKQEWESSDIQELSNLFFSEKHGLVGSCQNASGELNLFVD
jgi:hypothetical protein